MPRRRAPLRLYFFIAFLLFLISPAAKAEVKGKITEPQLLSVFPAVGQQGAKLQAEVRGNLIAGASSVWFEEKGLSGQVRKVEELREEAQPARGGPEDGKREKPLPVYRVSLDVQIAPGAAVGNHALRLIGPFGLSNSVPFRVVNEPVILETPESHTSVKDAQPVKLPALINGRLNAPGQLDFYSFEAKEGQDVSIQAVPSEKVDIHLAVYRPGGSWFDPGVHRQRIRRQSRESDQGIDLEFATRSDI